MKSPLAGNASGWSPATIAPADETVPDFWPNRDISQFRHAAGIRWHLQSKGVGDCILLIHGTGSSTHTWREVLPVLAERFHVVAIDLPGHGFSLAPAGRAMSLAALTAEVANLLLDMKLQPRAIVGHSAGAAIAIELAVRQHLPAAALVGVNAALLPYGGSLAPLFAPLAKAFAILPLVPALVRLRVRDADAVRQMIAGTGSVLDDYGIELYRYLLSRTPHVRATLRMMAEWDLRTLAADMATVADRCHLLVGDNDKAVSPAESRRLASRFPLLQRTVLAGLGHLAQEENPLLVAKHLDNAIAGMSVRQ